MSQSGDKILPSARAFYSSTDVVSKSKQRLRCGDRSRSEPVGQNVGGTSFTFCVSSAWSAVTSNILNGSGLYNFIEPDTSKSSSPLLSGSLVAMNSWQDRLGEDALGRLLRSTADRGHFAARFGEADELADAAVDPVEA